MAVEIPEALIRIRDKYPASKCLRPRWDEIKALVVKGKEDEAEAIAKGCLQAKPQLLVRNKIAVKQRILRRDFLRYQRDLEKQVYRELQNLSDTIQNMLLNSADRDGTIPQAKMKPLLDRLKVYNRDAFRMVFLIIAGGVRSTVKQGIVHTMMAAQYGLEHHKEVKAQEDARLLDVIGLQIKFMEAERQAVIRKTSNIFQTIFDKVKQRSIKGRLFRNQPGVARTGVSLSRRVWDIRDWHLRRIRNRVATGIAQGEPASKIANDIKGYTTAGRVSVGGRGPEEPGTYKSAYKNALRVTRTETNNAYVDAQTEYTNQKGFKMMWNVSVGHRDEDVCNDFDGKVYDPDEIKDLYPQHPNCSCYFTTVLPEIG